MEPELIQRPAFVWTAAHARPRCEKMVAEYAARFGVMCYLPLRRKVKRHQRRTVESFLPMFPGYLFVRLGEGDKERLVQCHRIVRFFDMTPEREERLLADLRDVRALELAARDVAVVVNPGLVRGLPVVIRSGPLRGVRGIVERRRDATRVTVNVEMLGQSVSAEVDVGDLEAVE